MWSIKSKIQFLSVTIYYLDKNCCMQQKLIDFKLEYAKYNAQTIYLTIIEVLNYYVKLRELLH